MSKRGKFIKIVFFFAVCGEDLFTINILSAVMEWLVQWEGGGWPQYRSRLYTVLLRLKFQTDVEKQR